MNKDEIIAKVQSKFYKYIGIDAGQPRDGMMYYRIKVYDQIGTGLRDQNIAILVEDEGLPTEVAHWYPAEPKPTKDENALALLIAFLDSRIGDGAGGTVRAYKIVEGTLNIAMRQVVVEGLLQNWIWTSFLVTHDGTDFQITPFG